MPTLYIQQQAKKGDTAQNYLPLARYIRDLSMSMLEVPISMSSSPPAPPPAPIPTLADNRTILPLTNLPQDRRLKQDEAMEQGDDEEGYEMGDEEEEDDETEEEAELLRAFRQRLADQQMADAPDKLLVFADNLTRDIDRFFGRGSDEDACDVYEDKWTSGKSGRELYYAELLRIAQGDSDKADRDSNKKAQKDNLKASTLKTVETSRTDAGDQASGRGDPTLGLGPLQNLFDYGLRRCERSACQFETRTDLDIVPMTQRKLPGSFWSEPVVASAPDPTENSSPNGQQQSENAARNLDLSDLLSSWESGENNFADANKMSAPEAAKV